jgi:hypothetical protein
MFGDLIRNKVHENIDTSVEFLDYVSDRGIADQPKRNQAMLYIQEKKLDLVSWVETRKFVVLKPNNFTILEESDGLIEYVVRIPRNIDVIDNFICKHKLDVTLNSEHEPISSEFLLFAMPYVDMNASVYFEKDSVPESFELSYRLTIFSSDLSINIRKHPEIHTETHTYENGTIKRLLTTT